VQGAKEDNLILKNLFLEIQKLKQMSTQLQQNREDIQQPPPLNPKP
jgi:hypothetical protein